MKKIEIKKVITIIMIILMAIILLKITGNFIVWCDNIVHIPPEIMNNIANSLSETLNDKINDNEFKKNNGGSSLFNQIYLTKEYVDMFVKKLPLGEILYKYHTNGLPFIWEHIFNLFCNEIAFANAEFIEKMTLIKDKINATKAINETVNLDLIINEVLFQGEQIIRIQQLSERIILESAKTFQYTKTSLINLHVMDSTLELLNDFYGSFVMNPQIIKCYSAKIDYMLLLEKYDGNLLPMLQDLGKNYMELLLDLKKEYDAQMSCYRKNLIAQYLDTLKLSFAKTVEFLNGHLKFKNYLDFRISKIEINEVSMLNQTIHDSIKFLSNISLNLKNHIQLSNYTLIDCFTIVMNFSTFESVSSLHQHFFENSPTALSTIPPIEGHILTPGARESIQKEVNKLNLMKLFITIPQLIHIEFEGDTIYIYIALIFRIRIK